MSELYERLSKSMQQAESLIKTGKPGTRQSITVYIPNLPVFTAPEIRGIREQYNITQKSFAKYLGVSLKTVQAWEYGYNQPSGCARRVLEMLKEGKGPVFFTKEDL